MSKSKITTERVSTLSRLYPVEEILFNDVVIEVRPLPYGKVPGSIELISRMIQLAMDGKTSELLEAPLEGLNRLLNACITIPEDPELSVEDLPFPVIPEIIDTFIDQNIDLGKLQALFNKRGINITGMLQSLMSQSLSQ